MYLPQYQTWTSYLQNSYCLLVTLVGSDIKRQSFIYCELPGRDKASLLLVGIWICFYFRAVFALDPGVRSSNGRKQTGAERRAMDRDIPETQQRHVQQPMVNYSKIAFTFIIVV